MAAEKEPMKEILGTSKEQAIDGIDEIEAILKDLPKEKIVSLSSRDLYLHQYQGFWVPDLFIRGVVFAQKNFVARNDDIILASCPKTGTTWLKALAFSIVYRSQFSLSDSPLLESHTHDVVSHLEKPGFSTKGYQFPDLETGLRPRVLATHIPYDSLPPSIKTSSSKIVYISRNPMDQFVSEWHFTAKFNGDEDAEPDNLDECFDRFSRGIHWFGPFWDHVLGFWKASLERPEKILFLKYENLKKDPVTNIKKLAEFLGFPFSEEEDEKGVMEEILSFCSIRRIRYLEVHKSGFRSTGLPRSAFFRKGEVGDSKNFLTSVMVEKMEKLMQEKYGDQNLTY